MTDRYLPFITIDPMIRAGVFEAGNDVEAASAPDATWALTVPKTTWLFQYDADAHVLTLHRSTESNARHVVEIAFAGRGPRTFFVCNCCGAARDRLALDGDELVCFYRYEHSGGAEGRALRMARRIFASEDIKLRRAKVRRLVPDECAPKPPTVEPGVSKRSSEPKKRSTSPFGTEAAIERGRLATDDRWTITALVHPPGQWQAFSPSACFSEPDRVARIDHFPELNARVLTPILLRDPPKLKSMSLLWGHNDYRQEVLLIVDGRGKLPHLIVGHKDLAGSIRWQPLPLVRHTNGSFSFVCPIKNKNFVSLYLRGGFFASRVAQRLAHRSQRTSWMN